MKQFFFILLLSVSVALGTCCQKNKSTNPDTKEPNPERVTDYYPLAIGNSWTYVLFDQSGQILWDFSYTIADTMTIGGNFGYLFSDIMFIYAKGDTIFSLSPSTMERSIVLLGPLVVGQSWTADFYTYELIGFETVTLTKGTEYQNCAKIKKTRPGSPGEETFEWWAKNVGKVKMAEYISGRYQGGMELESFTHP